MVSGHCTVPEHNIGGLKCKIDRNLSKLPCGLVPLWLERGSQKDDAGKLVVATKNDHDTLKRDLSQPTERQERLDGRKRLRLAAETSTAAKELLEAEGVDDDSQEPCKVRL